MTKVIKNLYAMFIFLLIANINADDQANKKGCETSGGAWFTKCDCRRSPDFNCNEGLDEQTCKSKQGQVISGCHCPQNWSTMSCTPDATGYIRCSPAAGKCISAEEHCKLMCSQNRPSDYSGSHYSNGACSC